MDYLKEFIKKLQNLDHSRRTDTVFKDFLAKKLKVVGCLNVHIGKVMNIQLQMVKNSGVRQ